LVGAVVWAIFVFVFDENKVNFYEAKVSTAEAETREVLAKNEVLATRIEYLTEDNSRMKEWLENIPTSIPHYEKLIKDLISENAELKKITLNTATTEPNPQDNSLYKSSVLQGASSAFIDNKTKAVFGVGKIHIDNSADVNLTLPSGEKIKVERAFAGETWNFGHGDNEYMFVLESVDWPTAKFGAS